MPTKFLSLAIPCAMSDEGEARFPKYRGKRGYIVGKSRASCCWRVRFPHLKYPVAFHMDFIRELVPAFVDGTVLVTPQIDAVSNESQTRDTVGR